MRNKQDLRFDEEPKAALVLVKAVISFDVIRPDCKLKEQHYLMRATFASIGRDQAGQPVESFTLTGDSAFWEPITNDGGGQLPEFEFALTDAACAQLDTIGALLYTLVEHGWEKSGIPEDSAGGS